MTQFTSSAKTLTYYADTMAVRELCDRFGGRLESLSQHEKYRLCVGISLELMELSNPEDEDEDADYISHATFGPDVVNQSRKIIDNEEPAILAQLLPAIAEYARDDDR